MRRLLDIVAVALLAVGCAHEPSPFDRLVAEHPELLREARAVDGDLKLTCDHEDAEVYVDGVLQGLCGDFGPNALVRLSDGPHEIEVRKPGFVPYRAQVLAGDARTSLNVVLAPMN